MDHKINTICMNNNSQFQAKTKNKYKSWSSVWMPMLHPKVSSKNYHNLRRDVSALNLPVQVLTAVLLLWHELQCKLLTFQILVNKTKSYTFLGATAAWVATSSAHSTKLVFRFLHELQSCPLLLHKCSTKWCSILEGSLCLLVCFCFILCLRRLNWCKMSFSVAGCLSLHKLLNMKKKKKCLLTGWI